MGSSSSVTVNSFFLTPRDVSLKITLIMLADKIIALLQSAQIILGEILLLLLGAVAGVRVLGRELERRPGAKRAGKSERTKKRQTARGTHRGVRREVDFSQRRG
jgi:uncharacterized membrane-anchored protein